jgi:hypothetical protein
MSASSRTEKLERLTLPGIQAPAAAFPAWEVVEDCLAYVDAALMQAVKWRIEEFRMLREGGWTGEEKDGSRVELEVEVDSNFQKKVPSLTLEKADRRAQYFRTREDALLQDGLDPWLFSRVSEFPEAKWKA